MSKTQVKPKKFFFKLWILILAIPIVFIYIPIRNIVLLSIKLYYNFKILVLKIKLTNLNRKEQNRMNKQKIIEISDNILVFRNKTLFPIKENKYTGQNKTLIYLDDHISGYTNKAHNNRIFIYFLLPSLGAFLVFVFTPFIMGIYYSMTNWTGLNTGHETFVWFQNYKTLLKDYAFFYSFYRTAIYSVLNIVVINVVAFSLALLVTQKLKLKNIYRAGFFMPNLIGGLVLGYIWQFVFNNAVTAIGGAFSGSLIIDSQTAMFALIVVVTWQYAGYIMMIYIAAIQNVPQDLVEASQIDGATALQRLRHITFPLVAQAFTVSLFLTLVTSFKQFDTISSLTAGGPPTLLPGWIADMYNLSYAPAVKSLNLMAINIYNEAFVFSKMGVGQAKAIIFFIALLGFSIVQVNYNKKREVEL